MRSLVAPHEARHTSRSQAADFFYRFSFRTRDLTESPNYHRYLVRSSPHPTLESRLFWLTCSFQGNLRNPGDSSTFGKGEIHRRLLPSSFIIPNQRPNHHIPDSAIPSSSVRQRVKLEEICDHSVVSFALHIAIMLDASYIASFV